MTSDLIASWWFVLKIIYLVGFVLYLIFATITVRQVYLMTSTLKLEMEFIIKFLAWIHLCFAVVILLLALINL